MSIWYIFLTIVNLIVFAVYFHKDPVAATAIFVGVTAALAISGLITLIERLIKHHQGDNNE